ncbi:unnamed protein product [Microthlaspi erraticum]|uniref:Uncharacterized protein n=1 Tax=Microthlaspi erraticum TaxID=1685480 RepID=A0A6D2KD87_9BRAS|nr:unnamed protein product [Microthlaspi erraticum]
MIRNNVRTSSLLSLKKRVEAIARLNLLKLIKAVYEHHPRPKQLIVENDLPQKLQNLIEERRDGQRSGGQVLNQNQQQNIQENQQQNNKDQHIHVQQADENDNWLQQYTNFGVGYDDYNEQQDDNGGNQQ